MTKLCSAPGCNEPVSPKRRRCAAHGSGALLPAAVLPATEIVGDMTMLSATAPGKNMSAHPDEASASVEPMPLPSEKSEAQAAKTEGRPGQEGGGVDNKEASQPTAIQKIFSAPDEVQVHVPEAFPKVCSVDGCDGERIARGLCSRHYQRLRTYGDPLAGGPLPPRPPKHKPQPAPEPPPRILRPAPIEEPVAADTPAKSPKDVQAEARARILKADPIQFLIDCMRGAPLPILDPDGNIIGYERVEAAARAAAADRLLKRIVPELKSVEMSTGEGGVTFKIMSSFPLPGSARPELLEGTMTSGDLANGLRQLAVNTIEEGDDR